MYDKIIIGAGIYGLYAALSCGRRGQNVLVLECDKAPFTRATYINQARVHQGYHYPRSLATALKSAGYFERFNREYAFCINSEFDQVYATSARYSWTDRDQFINFCKAADIPCEELPVQRYFKEEMCDGAFLTREYTYDAMILKDYFLSETAGISNIKIQYDSRVERIEKQSDRYEIEINGGNTYQAPYVLDAAYAGTNQILNMAGYEMFEIKYELCEIILCEVNEKLRNCGITVMDGPFFSVMPFGKTGCHSLTSVAFTPHATCYKELPEFSCQSICTNGCSKTKLGNCNECNAKPHTAFAYMSSLARKYIRDDYEFHYKKSLFSMKPILMSSEIDDSRPTVIRTYSEKPTFVAVLSGKINTIFDLDEILL